MIKPGNGCDITGLVKEMWDIGSDFTNNKQVKKRFGKEASNIVKTVFEDVFSLPIESLEAVKLTKGTLGTFQRRLNKVLVASEKNQLTHKFGSLFYTPSGVAEKNPQLINLMDNLHNVNLSYQGRADRHNRAFKNVIGFMRKQMLIDGFDKESMFTETVTKRRMKKAQKQADKLESDIEILSVDVWNNVPGAKDKLGKALELENNFYIKGEGKIFNEMLKSIEKDLPLLEQGKLQEWWKAKAKLLPRLKKGKMTIAEYNIQKQKTLLPILAEYGMKNPKSALASEPMRNGVAEYLDLMNDMHSVLNNGIDAYVSSLKEGMKGKYTSETIDKIASDIKTKISPEKQTGYFPHYKRVLNVDFLDNLMPHMQKVSDAVAENLQSQGQTVDNAIDALGGYVSGRAKGRKVVKFDQDVSAENEYSRNFFTTVKRYIDEIDRFNMVAHADKHTRESLNAAKEMFSNGKPLDGYAQKTVEMMKDMNARMKGGYGFENENAEAAMKTLLALEFTSKLGFNLRSPFKNATQGLLNFVEFGPIMMKKANEFYDNKRSIKLKVDDMMNEAGFLFAENAAPELIEGQTTGKSFAQKIRITDNESVEFKKPSALSTIHGKVNKLAGVSGTLMAKVENFNRKTTFKTGFYKMYEQLNNSTAYKNKLRKEGRSESEIEAEIMKRARNYAIRKTTLLHFDYADVAKAPWLLNPAGRLIGQFQHYGIKFLEYNIDKVKTGADDIMAGELLGDRAKSAYGLGLTYFLAPAIASAVTGLDFGNIVEHNTRDQINKLFALFTGDEAEIKKAYYGKGVLTGLPFIGAPVISDALALGNIWEFLDLDDENLEMLLTGYEDYALKSGDQKIYETIRLLNVQLGRGYYKTLPSILDGNIGSAMQHELGIYKTQESKKLKDNAKAMLPEDIVRALALLDEHKKQATKKGTYLSK